MHCSAIRNKLHFDDWSTSISLPSVSGLLSGGEKANLFQKENWPNQTWKGRNTFYADITLPTMPTSSIITFTHFMLDVLLDFLTQNM